MLRFRHPGRQIVKDRTDPDQRDSPDSHAAEDNIDAGIEDCGKFIENFSAAETNRHINQPENQKGDHPRQRQSQQLKITAERQKLGPQFA